MLPVRNETVKKNYISDQPNTAHVRLEVLTVVLAEIQVFWGILHCLIPKVRALCSFKILELFNQCPEKHPQRLKS
jgi:hypothetical protein